MKRFALCLVAFSLLAMSGCVTYQYRDATEDRVISQEQEFRRSSSDSQFAVASDSNGWGIRLAYIDNYNAYTITKHASYRVNYRQPTVLEGRWADSRPAGDEEKVNETLLREWSTDDLSQKNAKAETHTIPKGSTVTITVSSGAVLTFALDQDGVLPLNDVVCNQVLAAISTLDDLKKIGCKSLGFSKTLDLSPAPVFHDAIANVDSVIQSLAPYKIAPTDSVQRYDESQKALVTLTKTYRYAYQRHLIKVAFDVNYQTVTTTIQSQIDSLQASIPTYIISGQVNDQGDGAIQVWGTATPRPVTSQTLRSPGCQMNAANLIVENPDDSGFRGNGYISMTQYFIGKESGTNAMGMTVPVYRYTTKMPPAFQSVNAQITDLQARLDALTKAHSDASSQFATE
jgi:hypothetical protein